jgi:phage gp29-like protein
MSALLTALRWFGIKREPAAEPIPLVRRRLGMGGAGGYVIPQLPVWAQLQRIGGSLTPVEVSAIIREADTGRTARLCDLANEARQKDCHLQSILATSEESIAGLEWTLELPDDALLREKKAAEWVEQQLRSCRAFSRFLAHQAGAVYYGHAVSEILWAKVAGKLAPVELCAIAPRRFLYDETGGRLHWWDESGVAPYPGVDIRAKHPNKFVVSQPRVNGDVQCREGLVRVLMWAALFRNWAISDWLKLGEIAWKPWRWGKYSKDQSGDDEINALIATLDDMASTGVAAFPQSTDIMIEWPKGQTPTGGMHRELFTTVGSEMSKAVLGQTLTTEQGDRGARSLGEVHDNVRRDLRENRACSVAEDVQRDLVEAMYRLNFSEGIRPGRFTFLTEDATDLVAFATAIEKLAKAGLRMPAQWARDEIGCPEPNEDEELVGDGIEEEEAEPPEDPEGGPDDSVSPDDAEEAAQDAA